MANLKELSKKKEGLARGHRLCVGCGEGTAVRQILLAAPRPLVCAVATGCLEVSTTVYPYTSWNCSYIHLGFENAAATLSGVEAAYEALKARGKVEKEFYFIAFAGDGGTYDIGLQSLSGALERGHRMLYVCLDNGAYMNTGIQRSGSTPLGAWTTTTPVGKKEPGNLDWRKDLTAIAAAHRGTYVAQATISHWKDLTQKVEKALSHPGPSLINVLAPCPRGWRTKESQTVKLARLAVETCYWPLFEVENGKWKITVKPREIKPIEEWLKIQGRFKHLFSKEENRVIVDKIQQKISSEWERLLALSSL